MGLETIDPNSGSVMIVTNASVVGLSAEVSCDFLGVGICSYRKLAIEARVGRCIVSSAA